MRKKKEKQINKREWKINGMRRTHKCSRKKGRKRNTDIHKSRLIPNVTTESVIYEGISDSNQNGNNFFCEMETPGYFLTISYQDNKKVKVAAINRTP